MNTSQAILDQLKDINEAQSKFSLEEINKLLSPVVREMDKIKSDADYQKFLKKYSPYGDVIDQYLSPNLGSSADKVHYNQSLDRELNEFLQSLQED